MWYRDEYYNILFKLYHLSSLDRQDIINEAYIIYNLGE